MQIQLVQLIQGVLVAMKFRGCRDCLEWMSSHTSNLQQIRKLKRKLKYKQYIYNEATFTHS